MAVEGTCSTVFVLTRVAFYERTHERKEEETKVELANAKQALRNGIATNDQAENYAQFKIALTKICPFNHTR